MRKDFLVGTLKVSRFDTRSEMGQAGAKEAAELIRSVYTKKGCANIIFASSPSQIDLLMALLKEDVDWKKVNAFHMDEYIGLSIEHKASFANYIRENFFALAKPGAVWYLDGLAKDTSAECRRYEKLLFEYPTDITFAGIGENGHMAFNDPAIADFFEKDLVKINHSLDAVCRQQQINDGWFKTLAEVPDSAFTVTFYGLLRADHIMVMVPGKTKSAIVKACLKGPICPEVPSSIIRVHRNVRMFIDKDSASELTEY
jgi:glucosamine-6-phosphate deaminase